MLKAIANELKKAKRVLIFPHISPDGDALGSCTALFNALKDMGVSSDIILIDELPARYDFLAEYDCFVHEPKGAYDVHIALDVADEGRLGSKMKDLFYSNPMNIVVDHHGTNPEFAHLNFVSPEAATGSLVYDLIELMGVSITRDIANCVYVALSTDTGNFVYANTDKNAFDLAAKLVSAGAEIPRLADLLFRRTSEKTTRVIGAVISTLKTYYDAKLAIVHVTLDTLDSFAATKEHCDDVINYARDIDTVQVAAFVYELKDGRFKVSMRSKGDIDVASVALSHGGGGHKPAAGFTLKCSLDQAISTIISEFSFLK